MEIFKQETDKSCGVACLRSIFNHYGNNFSEKDIWEKNAYFGTKYRMLNPMLTLGVVALKFGFDVEYIGYHPIIVNGNKKDTLKDSLKEKSKNNFDFGKYYVDKAIEFLNLKGKITIDKLNINKIKKIIDKNHFAIVEVKPAMLGIRISLNMHHKVIIKGYNKKGFKVLDPSDAKEHLLDYESFLLAFYAAIPEMIIINNK